MYNKLFTKILDSSIWDESEVTRIVWITMLAAMDEDGFVEIASLKGLARRANIEDVDAVEDATLTLQSPDDDDTSGEHEGRRVERVPGGWMVLNSELYREIAKREHQKEQTRNRVRKHRAKQSCNADVTVCNESVTTSEAYAEASADADSESSSKQEDLSPASAGNGVPQCPHQEIIEAYHEILPELPRVRTWPEHRQKFLRARWREEGKRQDVDWWRQYFNAIREMPFLMGSSNGGWTASLEWLVRPTNFAKVLDGNYLGKEYR